MVDLIRSASKRPESASEQTHTCNTHASLQPHKQTTSLADYSAGLLVDTVAEMFPGFRSDFVRLLVFGCGCMHV